MYLFIYRSTQPKSAMSMFGWGVGDIIAISQLARNVYAAYKDAPSNYRYICEEVMSLHVTVKKAEQHYKSPTLSDNNRQQGQVVLKGCQSVLEDLNSFIEKYKSLASADKKLVFKKVKLGTEDIATLRARLTSNMVSLNGFIQRFDIDIPTITIEYTY